MQCSVPLSQSVWPCCNSFPPDINLSLIGALLRHHLNISIISTPNYVNHPDHLHHLPLPDSTSSGIIDQVLTLPKFHLKLRSSKSHNFLSGVSFILIQINQSELERLNNIIEDPLWLDTTDFLESSSLTGIPPSQPEEEI